MAKLLRVFRFGRVFSTLRQVMDIISNSMGSVGYISLLVLLFMFIFALLGMQVRVCVCVCFC